MLDLKTVLVVTFATASLQAVTWFFVWLAWRHLYELKFLGTGFTAIAFGLLLMIVRGEEPAAWEILLTNTIIKVGLLLLAYGLARFLGQPRYVRFGLSLLAAHIVAWSAAVALYPDHVAIRIHASTVFTIVAMSVMCLALMRDRTQPALLRWIAIGVLAEYMLASLVQSVIEYRLPIELQEAPVLDDRNAWYLLQGTLFLIAFFACLLFMVSSRLSADLREKNSILSREVQERRRLEIKLNASLEAERALREEQADFMRVVSHEFRTPFAVIRHAVDMIELVGNRSPDATRERIVGIGEALNRLFTLIDRFMANDRDSGFRPEAVRVGSLIAEVRLHFEMTGRGERLVFTADHDDVALFADPEMLATVLINLIDNALKYSAEDETVDIDVRREDASMVIRVRDHGIGIPAAELHKIGRRFFRASNTTAGTGTGLGLYSSRKLLVYHGGKLQLLANPGQGMTAIVRLPMSNEAADQPSLEEIMA